MPLRKLPGWSHRYCVQTRNGFLAQVQMLDDSVVECMWHVDSKGKECLEALMQSLGLTETQYFGLWFLTRSRRRRWVWPEKALKKQLDKFAAVWPLRLGVMHHVPDASVFKQKVTRHQYYLEVKKKILEGELQCCFEDTVKLAGLAVQADLGDFNWFQSSMYPREYVLFPVNWICTDEVKAEWTQKVFEEHKLNCGMSSAEAALLYIRVAEKLDDFGWESFAAKDSCGSFSYLGVSFSGVFVKTRNGNSMISYRWNDIRNITCSKSAVQLYSKDGNIKFQMDDAERAKYITRLLTVKQEFYDHNNICTQAMRSPSLIQRRTTWDCSIMPRPPSHTLKSNHSLKSGGHFQDALHSCGRAEGPYISESSLEQEQLDFKLLKSTVHDCCLYSSHSTVLPNLSWTVPENIDIQLHKHTLSRRHGASIAPSSHPTSDYESIRWQKPCPSTGAQPEVGEHNQFPRPFDPLLKHSLPAVHANVSHRCNGYPNRDSTTCHTVSTPELANTRLQGTHGHGAAFIPNSHMTDPKNPHSCVCPGKSTQAHDPYSHHLRCMGGSSPELVFRQVQLPLKPFQVKSYPVARHSLQDASEHIGATRRWMALDQRHSLEVMSSMVKDMETMAFRALNAPPLRRNTFRQQMAPLPFERPAQKATENLPSHQHMRSPFQTTVLVDNVSNINEGKPEAALETQRFSPCLVNNQLRAARARIPNKPPPEYPGLGRIISNDALKAANLAAIARMNCLDQCQGGHTGRDQTQLIPFSYGPSISEPNLTTVKERVQKKLIKERPVSEMFSIEDSIVEREIIQRTREKLKMETESREGPLRMAAAQNGSYVTGMPAPDTQLGDTLRDELSGMLENKQENEWVAMEYSRIPDKAADRATTSASLPGNMKRNRFHDILPYENNRAELKPNENNICQVEQGGEWHYSATQDLLPNTCQDFWQMVWEQGVNVIAMVTVEESRDVPTMLLRLWQQHMHLVQTLPKYKFVQQVLIYFKGSHLA